MIYARSEPHRTTERGVISSWNEHCVFVRYGLGSTAAGTALEWEHEVPDDTNYRDLDADQRAIRTATSTRRRPDMLVFENPGLIDMTAATTLGVNVKEGATPIGQFGSGLKIAISVILRLGGSIEIWRGKKLHTFAVRRKTIRGKEFGLVTMNGRDLGFTDAYGAHWEPWMAYREL